MRGMIVMNALKLNIKFIWRKRNVMFYQEVGWLCSKKLLPQTPGNCLLLDLLCKERSLRSFAEKSSFTLFKLIWICQISQA